MASADGYVAHTLGAVLLGALFASLLSGCVTSQVVAYAKSYPEDSLKTKLIVLLIWVLDLFHTSFIWTALWDYVVLRFGNVTGINEVSWSLSATIVLTALLTFLVHCFFARRIFLLSKKNWAVTVPIVILAVARLVSAIATIAKLTQLDFFSVFRRNFKWLFSLGLALSSGVDVIITVCLCFLLQKQKGKAVSLRLDEVIDSLMIYAVESGVLTAAATIVSMICWIVYDDNLIFMGLHFVISKLYANSIMASLNTRNTLRNRSPRRISAAPMSFSLNEVRDNSSSKWSYGSPKPAETALDYHLRNIDQIATTHSYHSDGRSYP